MFPVRRSVPAGELPIVGICAGEADAIQACMWTLKPAAGGSSSGKKGKAAKGGQDQRFTIIF